MKMVALLTDFGVVDNFVGVIKGVILRISSQVNLVDITHNVSPQDIFQGAFLLKSSFKYFPRGTIFLVIVDPGVGSSRKAIVVRTKNYFFVGPNNGVLSPAVSEDGIEEIASIENKKYFLEPLSNTFAGRDIFAPVTGYLCQGVKLNALGPSLETIEELNFPKPVINSLKGEKEGFSKSEVDFCDKVDKNTLQGRVIYIDRFGNLITNISKEIFNHFVKNKKFKITIKNKEVTSIAHFYQSVERGKMLVIFNSFNLLEIAVGCGRASECLKVKRDEEVRVVVKERETALDSISGER